MEKEKCIRCGYKWKGDEDDKPSKCPNCEYAYWDREEGYEPPTYRNNPIKTSDVESKKL